MHVKVRPLDKEKIEMKSTVEEIHKDLPGVGVAVEMHGDGNDDKPSSTSPPQTRSFFHQLHNKSFFHASNSKFVKKIYRSENALKNEQRRQREAQTFTIHPFSDFRWYWDILMVFLMFMTLILLPVNIAFFSDEIRREWVTINCIADGLFMIDIVLNFCTGIARQHGEVILQKRRIAWCYLKGWFPLDFISSFPFDYIYFTQENFGEEGAISDEMLLKLRILRLIKVLSLLRLLRLSRLMRYAQRLEELLNIDGAIISIVNLVIFALVVTHWNCCLQFLVPFFMDFPVDSWVSINNLQNASKWEQYSWSFFKSICHMLGLGFGRYPPANITEMWLTVISVCFGATFYALFIGHMSTLLLSIDASARLYNERINQVKEYMKFHKVPFNIQKRILDYYEHRYQRKYFNDHAIMSEQNRPIRLALVQHQCKSLINKVDFLANADQDFVSDLIQKLEFEVYLERDEIIQANTRGTAMYFIEHGSVDIIVDGQVIGKLSDGDHFGEIALLTDIKRVATVVASATCDLYSLSRDNFNEALSDHPAISSLMTQVANERLSKNKDSSEQSQSI
ncbi:potassium/sodium hyperpolarization-activated cyclic nucleotide-gated channel 2-like isoform X2 [Antedon mediterranea]|uniref:potassium/sodium hyperpolarization-activated cyclic nucleotide-gated channel 2-like isoform X2 n=1 Tax=Antedon mediterranea TaxID=105859 RepID=UPI003AF781B0